jgi:glycosyltransferase involved in cell wall biosynthesis
VGGLQVLFMKLPEISVIMLTYNRESLVSRAIESVLAQTFTDFEFIIVDNGSTDKSGAIADEYAACDNRVKVIHRERGNIGSGRNAGLDVAQGNYVAFIDDDDWCEPGFLEFLHNLAVENAADVSICGSRREKSDGTLEPKYVYPEVYVQNAEEAVVDLLGRRHFNTAFPTKLFKRELVETLRFPKEGRYDDIALMHKVLAAARTVAHKGAPQYVFSRHGSNNSDWTLNHGMLTAETLNEYLSVYRERTLWLSERFPNSAGAWRYFEWSFMLSMVEKIIRLELKGCETQLNAMLAELRENREEFLSGGFVQNFEREWAEKYVRQL